MINLKKIKTDLGLNIYIAMPMIEEVTEKGQKVICVVGVAVNPDNNEAVDCTFVTLNDEFDESVYLMCKAYAEKYKSKDEKS